MEGWPLFSTGIRAIKLRFRRSRPAAVSPWEHHALSPAVLRLAARSGGSRPAACGEGRGPSQFGGEPNRSPISPPCRERTVGVAAFRELEGGLHHASYTRNSDNRLTDGGPVDCAVATCCIFPVDRRQILPSPARQVRHLYRQGVGPCPSAGRQCGRGCCLEVPRGRPG